MLTIVKALRQQANATLLVELRVMQFTMDLQREKRYTDRHLFKDCINHFYIFRLRGSAGVNNFSIS